MKLRRPLSLPLFELTDEEKCQLRRFNRWYLRYGLIVGGTTFALDMLYRFLH